MIYGLSMWVEKSSIIKSLDFSISNRDSKTTPSDLFFCQNRYNVCGIDFGVLKFFDKHEHVPENAATYSPLRETTLGGKTYTRIRVLPHFLSPARWHGGFGFLDIKTHGGGGGYNCAMFVEICYTPVAAHLNDNILLLDRLNYLNNFVVSTSTWKPVNLSQIKEEQKDKKVCPSPKKLMWTVSDKAFYRGRVPADTIPSEPVLYGGYVDGGEDSNTDQMVDMLICSNTAFFDKSRNSTCVKQHFIRVAQLARVALRTKFILSFAERVFVGLNFGSIHKIYWTGDHPFGKIIWDSV
jgi:hypothetical protein